jgi:thymidylate synthase (FAD)
MITATYKQHMGNDLMVVNAARVSFAKESAMFNDKDAGLISYLAKHNHKSPFNHTGATFHVKAPIFVARQLVKHEYMPWNEVSRRYVDDEPEFYEPDVWRGRAKDKKQGSSDVDMTEITINEPDSYFDGDYVDDKAGLQPWVLYTANIEDIVQDTYERSYWTYEKLINGGVAPEQARMVLPQSTMTEWYWSGTLFAFAKMCNLRCAPDTQLETRLVANQICDKMRELFPVSWLALRGL